MRWFAQTILQIFNHQFNLIIIEEGVAPATPLTLASVLKDILESGEQDSRYGKIRDLKLAARVFNFMQENDIFTMPNCGRKFHKFIFFKRFRS